MTARLLLFWSGLALLIPQITNYQGKHERLPIKVALQPVPFNHLKHSSLGLGCQQCHSGASLQERAGFPPIAQCMLCHDTLQKDEPEIQKLVRQLGQEDSAIRERASSQLVELGLRAVPALEGAIVSSDLEVASRARNALQSIRTAATLARVAPPPLRVTLKGDGGTLDNAMGHLMYVSGYRFSRTSKSTSSRKVQPYDLKDVPFWEALQELVTTPSLIGAMSGTGGAVVADNGRRIEQVMIVGISPEMFTIRDWVVENGRPFSDQEASRGTAVVIIGKDPAEALFPSTDPIGRTMRIRGFQYRIIGVLEEQGSIFGQSLDNMVIAPARSPIQAVTAPHGVVEQIIIQTLDPADLPQAKLQAEEIMRIRRRLRPGDPNNFAVETAEDTLSFWDRISQVLFLALPGLVAISLVVGGIVIMNIMLVSVLERTREIGVRKALGARRRDILTQVLIESVTLSGFGAMFGVGVGIGLTFLVRAVSPLPAAVAPKWVALGVILGLVVGIISGVYPASQASKLNPVDALRHE